MVFQYPDLEGAGKQTRRDSASDPRFRSITKVNRTKKTAISGFYVYIGTWIFNGDSPRLPPH